MNRNGCLKLFCLCGRCSRPLGGFIANFAAQLELLMQTLAATVQQVWSDQQWDGGTSGKDVKETLWNLSCLLISVRYINICTSFLVLLMFLFSCLDGLFPPFFPFLYIILTLDSLCSSVFFSASFFPPSVTRLQASENATRQLITSTNVSGTLSRPLWQQSARTYPAGTTSHWR